jgi:hypothetical protein
MTRGEKFLAAMALLIIGGAWVGMFLTLRVVR